MKTSYKQPYIKIRNLDTDNVMGNIIESSFTYRQQDVTSNETEVGGNEALSKPSSFSLWDDETNE